ncbi:YbdD/YjiX family protein [Streptomyces sp. CAU 1734]|uniref:YbdD/YjiX family protein n=1 Tax=Streptomyces sp. CAU 1734 TaxID=3140360 RepID=UPI003260EA13
MSAARLLSGLRRGLGAVRWYLREVSGETAYDRYCDRHRRTRPAVPPPSRREFQRMRARRQERESPSRCC